MIPPWWKRSPSIDKGSFALALPLANGDHLNRSGTEDWSRPGAGDTQRLSELMEDLDTGRDTTIGELVDTFGTHTFGATMLLFAAPNLVPNPPGTSPILGIPLLILAGQLVLGRKTVWLPG